MGKYSNYKLALKDLPIGKAAYKYELDNSFFKLINEEESDVKRGKLTVELNVTRSATAFEILFDVKGVVLIPCDRCLDDVSMEVNVQQKLIVKLGAEYSEESDEIVVIPETEGEINVAWFIYEFIVLSLPAKRVHPSGMCNKVVTQKLKKHRSTVASDEEEGDDDLEDDTDEASDDDSSSGGGGGNTDPRWDALKDLGE